MADDAENVLELDTDLELEDDDQPEQTDGDQPGEDGAEETVISFGEEGSAPDPAEESSVIRDLRRANRELAKKLAERERQERPQVVDPGQKPTLESCDYDEERFETELDNWKTLKAKADRAEQDAEERAKQEREAWTQRVETYKSGKAALKVSDFDAAEEEVFAVLPEQHQALLMMSEKPAALVYALAKNPGKLADLAKLDLTRAAMMVGKLEDKLQMTTRKPPAPDTPLRGNAPISAGRTDKELERLEKQAERTGDRTELIAYRRKLRDRASN